MYWYLEVLKKYANFRDRARRKEYWWFVLINLIIAVILLFVDMKLGLINRNGLGPFRGVYTILTLIPAMAVTVRRLHDTGRSGWWILIGIIPCVGGIIMLVFMVEDSHGPNEYGPNPKEEDGRMI